MREGLHKIVSDDETIVAIATPLGHSGIGVVRISGPRCLNIASRHFKPHSPKSVLQHRTALPGSWNQETDEPIDEVIVTFFQAPNSYTGEDVLEIGAHGNPFVLRRIVQSALETAVVRLAAPGEFTLRAVAHGKLDLMQAEAVKEFIEAQTEQQAKTALRHMEGSISKKIGPVKSALIDVIAYLEAGIDFAEDDVDLPANPAIAARIEPLRLQLEKLRDSFGYGKILAKGLRLAIVGKPNVGKSSLFNRLVSADRAIVTDIPGTTRDVLTETVSLNGVPLCFADTAGIRETTDEVESIGVMRARETLSESDVALVILDGSRAFDDEDQRMLDRTQGVPHIIVINKCDLPRRIEAERLNGANRVSVSARTGEGLTDLEAALHAFVVAQKTTLSDDLVLTTARQFEAVSTAANALSTAEQALGGGVPHEMVLLDLYRAVAALDELTGDVVTEDILDRIFSTFCIGK
jgi:tRNA modification GTPase